jgi:hypothetical protein
MDPSFLARGKAGIPIQCRSFVRLDTGNQPRSTLNGDRLRGFGMDINLNQFRSLENAWRNLALAHLIASETMR